MRAFRAKHATRLGGAVVAGVVLWAAVYLLTGHRYRLYTDRLAAQCWRGVRRLALPTSSLRPRSVGAPSANTQDAVRVTIRYHMDRVLGGTLMKVTCIYGADRSAPQQVAMNGVPVGAATLRRIRRLAR